uniref:Uncharacterized protein n=1 Tax=Cannabis sativa TaxID=3483 RepID=A0A803QRD9_CANSA
SSYGFLVFSKRSNLSKSKEFSRRNFVVQSCSTSAAGEVGLVENETTQIGSNVKVDLATEFGWEVRKK